MQDGRLDLERQCHPRLLESCPSGLKSIVFGCLRTSPSDRFQSIHDVIRQLSVLTLEHQPATGSVENRMRGSAMVAHRLTVPDRCIQFATEPGKVPRPPVLPALRCAPRIQSGDAGGRVDVAAEMDLAKITSINPS